MSRCPVCGALDGRCGDTPLVRPVAGLREPDGTPMRVTHQVVRRGMRAGYKGETTGDVVVVDPTPIRRP